MLKRGETGTSIWSLNPEGDWILLKWGFMFGFFDGMPFRP